MGGKSHNTTSPRLLTLVYVEVTCVHMSEHAVNTKDIRFPHCECFYMLSMNDACVCVRVLVFSCLHGRNGRRRGKKIV